MKRSLGLLVSTVVCICSLGTGVSLANQLSPFYEDSVQEASARTGLDFKTTQERLRANSASSSALSNLKAQGANWLAGSWIDTESLTQYVAVVKGTPQAKAQTELRKHGFEGHFVQVEADRSLHDLGEAADVVADSLRKSKFDDSLGNFAVSLNEQTNQIDLLIDEQSSRAQVEDLRGLLADDKLPVQVVPTPGESLQFATQACSIPHCDRPLRGGQSL